MEIEKTMKKPVITVAEDASIAEAASIMRDSNVGCLVVVKNQQVTGILTDRDIATRVVPIAADLKSALVKDYMSPDPITVMPSDSVMDALDIMKRRKVKRLPVVFAGQLQGIIALVDIAETMEPTTRDLLTGLKESRHNV